MTDTYSEEWRLECEARFILTMTLAQRRAYLSKLKPARRNTLEAEMRRQWAANKAAGPPQGAAGRVNSSSAIE